MFDENCLWVVKLKKYLLNFAGVQIQSI